MKHKHAKLIKAWADGAEIQFREYEGKWNDFEPNGYACWHQNMEYRIKPEPKPDVVAFSRVFHIDTEQNYTFVSNASTTFFDFCNLKLTFDGETGKLKSAEVI